MGMRIAAYAINIGDEVKLGDFGGITPQCGGGWAGGKLTINQIYCNFGFFLSSILPNIYVIASIILFILLIVSGLLFIINAGQGDEEGAKKYQKTITASLIGFLLIFASYWVIEIIQTITGVKILNSTI